MLSGRELDWERERVTAAELQSPGENKSLVHRTKKATCSEQVTSNSAMRQRRYRRGDGRRRTVFCHWFIADSSEPSDFEPVIAAKSSPWRLRSRVSSTLAVAGTVDPVKLPVKTPEPSVRIAKAGTAASIVHVKLRAVMG